MSNVCVNVKPPYCVLLEKGAFARLGEEVKRVVTANKVLVVTDSNVKKFYLPSAEKSLTSAGFECFSFTIEAGEKSKTPLAYLNIIDCLAKNGFKRTDAIVALGGGVVGDIAGFAGATYMRGIDVVQVPTTLLAMIDSSIGGKTGVDLEYGKNLLGAFHQPKLVLADVNLLGTLPEKEWTNGIGEGIKYACLTGGRIAEIMRYGIDDVNLEEFVSLCAECKAKIVSKDEKEGGLRKLLNLGHTVGHAIEKESNFEIAHGVAVAMGIAIMAKSALKHGEMDNKDFQLICNMLSKCGVTEIPYIHKNIISSISMDKKVEGKDDISVVTLRGIGNCAIQKFKLDEFIKYVSV